MLKKYNIENYNCGKLVDSSLENSSLQRLFDNGAVIKRGLCGNILIKRYDSYDDFCSFFKDVSANCKDIVKKNNCKRVLFIVVIESISESILEQYQKILMFDKEFNFEPVSYEVLFVDKKTGIGYFGGMNEKGKTLLYKDTLKMLIQKVFA